jgi:hypothetical protein
LPERWTPKSSQKYWKCGEIELSSESEKGRGEHKETALVNMEGETMTTSANTIATSQTDIFATLRDLGDEPDATYADKLSATERQAKYLAALLPDSGTYSAGVSAGGSHAPVVKS